MACREALATHDGPVLGRDRRLAADADRLDRRRCSPNSTRTRPACLLGTAIAAIRPGWAASCATRTADFRGIVEEKDATPDQRRITRSQHELLRVQLPRAARRAWTRSAGTTPRASITSPTAPACLQREGKPCGALPRAAAVRGAEHQHDGRAGGRRSESIAQSANDADSTQWTRTREVHESR